MCQHQSSTTSRKRTVSDLSGPALDWAVAKCEGRDMYFDADGEGPWFRDSDTHPDGFSTDYGSWEVCGPIIEREKIELVRYYNKPGGQWYADAPDGIYQWGPTPLIAAMRCFVAYKLDNEIEIPEELT